jgi:hypothetical protein
VAFCQLKSLISPEATLGLLSHLLFEQAPLLLSVKQQSSTFNIWLCRSPVHLPVAIMTVYDYLTPFEGQAKGQEHLPRELPLPHPDTEVQATKSSTSIDTPCFDVGPAFFI